VVCDQISYEMFRSVLRTDRLGEDVLLAGRAFTSCWSQRILTAHVSSFAGVKILWKSTRPRLTYGYLWIHTSGLAYLYGDGPFSRLTRGTTIKLLTDDWQSSIGERLLSAEAPIQEY